MRGLLTGGTEKRGKEKKSSLTERGIGGGGKKKKEISMSGKKGKSCFYRKLRQGGGAAMRGEKT